MYIKEEIEEISTLYTTKTEKRGRLKEIFASVAEKDYSLERGAQKAKMSIHEFRQAMIEAGFKIQEE